VSCPALVISFTARFTMRQHPTQSDASAGSGYRMAGSAVGRVCAGMSVAGGRITSVWGRI
jgi:hypothetical protein